MLPKLYTYTGTDEQPLFAKDGMQFTIGTSKSAYLLIDEIGSPCADDFHFELWFNCSTASYIIGNNNASAIFTLEFTANELQFRCGFGGVNNYLKSSTFNGITKDYRDSLWHHVHVSFKNGYGYMIVDGILRDVNRLDIIFDFARYSDRMHIGGFLSTCTFTGYIDDVGFHIGESKYNMAGRKLGERIFYPKRATNNIENDLSLAKESDKEHVIFTMHSKNISDVEMDDNGVYRIKSAECPVTSTESSQDNLEISPIITDGEGINFVSSSLTTPQYGCYFVREDLKPDLSLKCTMIELWHKPNVLRKSYQIIYEGDEVGFSFYYGTWNGEHSFITSLNGSWPSRINLGELHNDIIGQWNHFRFIISDMGYVDGTTKGCNLLAFKNGKFLKWNDNYLYGQFVQGYKNSIKIGKSTQSYDIASNYNIDGLKIAEVPYSDYVDENNTPLYSIGDKVFTPPARNSLKEYEDPTLRLELTIPSDNYQIVLPVNTNHNLDIEWGDGSTEHSETGSVSVTHTYATSGTYTLNVTGWSQLFSTYLLNNANFRAAVTKVLNFGNLSHPRNEYDHTYSFAFCSNLTETVNKPIYGLLWEEGAIYMFHSCTSLTNVGERILERQFKVNSVNNFFYNCTSLVNLSDNIFRGCVNCEYFYQTFYKCTNLSNSVLSENLFKYNTKALNFGSTFRDVRITDYSPDLFKYNTEVTSFAYTFSGSYVTTLYTETFQNCTKVTGFYYTFQNCPYLATLEAGCFDNNTIVTSFQRCFWLAGGSGTGISFSADIFKYNTIVTSFERTFSAKLNVAFPTDLFKYNTLANDLSYCFVGAQFTGTTTLSSGFFDYVQSNCNISGIFQDTNVSGTVPTGFFDNLTGTTSMFAVFHGTNISGIPTDLFRYCVAVTDFNQTFESTPNLASVPTDTFRYNTLVTAFGATFKGTQITTVPTDTFRYNTLVTSFYQTFFGSAISSIPTDLFRYNTLVTDFYRTFSSTQITEIPLDIFRYNTAAINFERTFESTKLLGTIPENIFYYNPLVTTYGYCFWRANNSASNNLQLPSVMFNTANLSIVTNFTSFMYMDTGGNAIGTIQDIWNYATSASHGNAFARQTLLTNYASIPNDWKGL